MDDAVLDVTLFRGAADNPYFELYFNALPAAAAENISVQALRVDLHPITNVSEGEDRAVHCVYT